MKLTELKRCIDEALKLHDDYDVKVNCKEINGCGVDSGRFNFNIHIDISLALCNEYHIKDDDSMEYCSICNCYYSADEECPRN